MPTKQWLQVEVDNEIVMYLLLSFISNLDFKPFLPIEATSETVYYRGHCKLLCRQKLKVADIVMLYDMLCLYLTTR